MNEQQVLGKSVDENFAFWVFCCLAFLRVHGSEASFEPSCFCNSLFSWKPHAYFRREKVVEDVAIEHTARDLTRSFLTPAGFKQLVSCVSRPPVP